MKREKDINNKIVAEINGYIIIRSETKKFDDYNQKFIGQTKVWYDICDMDRDLLDSFKTLREAKNFCN